MRPLHEADPRVFELIKGEERREFDNLRMIASENYVSRAVLEATGSVLTNKYSEGYIGRRYYEGQQFIDAIEGLAIERAKKLFGADHANVQTYSGSPANLAVYMATMKPGDTVMGMALPDGGHLTHGWKVSATGQWFNAVQYGVDPESGLLDFNVIRELALKHRPKLLIAGATAYPRIIDFAAFRAIADEVGATLLVDMAHIAGLVAGKAHPSPIPYADVVSTTTHKTLRGPRGAMLMCTEAMAKDIDKAVFPGLQGGPHNHTTAGIAVALGEALTPAFQDYAHQIVKNAQALAKGLAGHGFRLISGGTDNHLILMDVTPRGMTGKAYSQALDKAGIECNYNTVPNDPRKPFDPSGIRLGTAGVTSRGMKESDMVKIADWFNQVVSIHDDEAALAKVAGEVREFCAAFPAPGISIK
ncbi:MAG TPA: serine hydroxymethyltransferase [Myxococcota bacterium]|jgi:glycine hydroxymethyltransferase|nr:serine hydroxymethyltransferase [Myxococcota bacterium]HON25148.1 serine hydroxymethyltransferase [Myxococcota bacterium]HOS61533.1 serine hydroxymethyltransferase [Myxococcota bacterium]HPC91276.1 serine hydroxymethyltransferase [Myxococcota bacterium]HPL24674.1 serine hydroxymethyltransferase [Myxococcota bacterium]